MQRGWQAVGRGVALMAWSLGALAAPEDDFKRGELAYQRGDVVGAMAALRPATLARHAPSMTLLAFILDRADYPDQALGLYRDAAEQDDAEGHIGLANLYLTGRGVAKDEKLALAHFSKAADLGQATAIDAIATAWLRGQLGLNAETEPAQARAALLRAAERGHLASAEALAQAYGQGRIGLAVNPAEAARWQARVAEWRKQRSPKLATAKAAR